MRAGKPKKMDRYFLNCPRCDAVLYGMWFCQFDGHDDMHGLYCCSGCVSWMSRTSGLKKSLWERLPQVSDYCKFEHNSWGPSFARTRELIGSTLGETQPKKRRRDIQSDARACTAATTVPVRVLICSYCFHAHTHKHIAHRP